MLLALRKDSYKKAIQTGWRELKKDTSLIRELKEQGGIDEETHVIIFIEKITWQAFLHASSYDHNVERFHLALIEECVLQFAHACDLMKTKIPEHVMKDHNLI